MLYEADAVETIQPRGARLLGDAYAPRRLSFATRQARDLVRAVLS